MPKHAFKFRKGDAGPSDGDQVISVLPGLWMCIFMMYLGKLEMLW